MKQLIIKDIVCDVEGNGILNQASLTVHQGDCIGGRGCARFCLGHFDW